MSVLSSGITMISPDLLAAAPEHVRKRIEELAAQALAEAGSDLSLATDILLKRIAIDPGVRDPSIAPLLRHSVMVKRASDKA